MAAFPTTPHGAGPATGEISPAVINVRRPRLGATTAPTPAELVMPRAEDTLPPTVLRLPNLAALPGPPGTLNKVLSILHWCFIGLGSLIALWLIFAGRGGPKPGEDIPAAPVRAQAEATPAWNPPALDTAGDSNAPKWTPPPASVAPAQGAAPPSMNIAPPAATEPAPPSHESWPQGGSAVPPESPAAESPQPEVPLPEMPQPEAAAQPELPAAPAWQDASSTPAGAVAGPVARTAAREMPLADPTPGGEAHPLDLTVPVPQ